MNENISLADLTGFCCRHKHTTTPPPHPCLCLSHSLTPLFIRLLHIGEGGLGRGVCSSAFFFYSVFTEELFDVGAHGGGGKQTV